MQFCISNYSRKTPRHRAVSIPDCPAGRSKHPTRWAFACFRQMHAMASLAESGPRLRKRRALFNSSRARTMLQRWWEAAKRLGATVEVPPTKLPQGGGRRYCMIRWECHSACGSGVSNSRGWDNSSVLSRRVLSRTGVVSPWQMPGKCPRNPKNQQQYPIWRARERNLPLKRAEETGYIQDAGSRKHFHCYCM
jgi:hypothetical protein